MTLRILTTSEQTKMYAEKINSSTDQDDIVPLSTYVILNSKPENTTAASHR